MSRKITRRSLFAGLRGGTPQIRPPWAISEPSFSDTCEPCGRCIDACPQQILVRGHAGYPIVDFARGACTFCAACADACPHGCFIADQNAKPWDFIAEVNAACIEAKGVACRLCQDACDASAIRFQPRPRGAASLIIDDTACTGCGACVALCPAGALRIAISANAEVTA